MTHLSDGSLRRLLDEPLATGGADRAHLEVCAECRARGEAMAADAAVVATLLAVPDVRPDAALALGRVRRKLSARAFRWPVPARLRPALAAAAGIVLVVFALTSTGLAESFLRIFEPKRFVAVPVSESDLRALPDLSAYGTMSWSGPGATQWSGGARAFETGDIAAARTASGLPVLVPQRLPATADPVLQFRVVSPARMTFTFDPSSAMAGHSLFVDVGPLVMQIYRVKGGGEINGMPALVIIEARPPVVSSSGPTVVQLRDHLLAEPGVSPALAARIRAIAEPESTMPVPIPVDRVLARNVAIGGREGLLFGDSTGLGSVVFWRDGDVVRAVGGPLSDAEVLDIANALR